MWQHGNEQLAKVVALRTSYSVGMQVCAEKCKLLDEAKEHKGTSEPVFLLFRVCFLTPTYFTLRAPQCFISCMPAESKGHVLLQLTRVNVAC